jgi:uncharacterized RDD family membrane protein YckC
VKCPKCGFVSFPGLDQCKKCGQQFTPVEKQQPGIPPPFRRTGPEAIQPASPLSLEGQEAEQGFPLEDRDLNPASDPRTRFMDPPKPGAAEAAAPGPAAPLDWQKELAGRMQEFRRRRALISTGKEDDEKSFGLGFEPPASGPNETEPEPNLLEFPSFDEMNLQEDTLQSSDPDLDTLALETPQDESDSREPAMEAPRRGRRNVPAPSAPLEIEMESRAASASVVGGKGNASVLRIAPLGKRFFAGLFDLMVLVSAAGVFTLIFWQAGGRFALLPLNLVVAVLIGVIFLLAYFGVFMAFASGTPGLIWAGLEVRTFEGNPPKRTDCYWRTFGYLVSVSALLMGFIWALVDGEGLTWHDRMSRTFLVDAQDWETLQATTSVPT